MKRFGALVLAAVIASGLAWSSLGGIHAASGQTPTTPTEIHRAHTGSFEPDVDKTIYILVLGSDAGAPKHGRGGRAESGRADSIHIVAINPQLGAASIVGIPRDSYVPIPGRGQSKINAAMFFGGVKLMISTVEQLAGITFDYYMLTNFDDLAAMGTEFGGLTINVPYAMNDRPSRTNFPAGRRRLTGEQIVGFSRNRHDAPDGDFGRSRNQGSVLAAAQVEARTKLVKDPTQLINYLGIVRRHVKTDIPLRESLRLGLLALRIAPSKVKNVVLTGRTGATPAGSSVLLDDNARRILRDVADDGVLSG